MNSAETSQSSVTYIAMNFLGSSCFLSETFSKAIAYLSSTLLSGEYLRDNVTAFGANNANLSYSESLTLNGIIPHSSPCVLSKIKWGWVGDGLNR